MGRPPKKIDPELLRRLYIGEGKSMAQIAEFFGTNRETIRQRLHIAGIPVRPKNYTGRNKRFRLR